MKRFKTIKSYTLYTLLVAFVFCGCSNTRTKNLESDYKVIIIEDCEYIVYNTFSGYIGYGYMAHKGNCKACSKKK